MKWTNFASCLLIRKHCVNMKSSLSATIYIMWCQSNTLFSFVCVIMEGKYNLGWGSWTSEILHIHLAEFQQKAFSLTWSSDSLSNQPLAWMVSSSSFTRTGSHSHCLKSSGTEEFSSVTVLHQCRLALARIKSNTAAHCRAVTCLLVTLHISREPQTVANWLIRQKKIWLVRFDVIDRRFVQLPFKFLHPFPFTNQRNSKDLGNAAAGMPGLGASTKRKASPSAQRDSKTNVVLLFWGQLHIFIINKKFNS